MIPKNHISTGLLNIISEWDPLSNRIFSLAFALSDEALLEHNFVEADTMLRLIWKEAEVILKQFSVEI